MCIFIYTHTPTHDSLPSYWPMVCMLTVHFAANTLLSHLPRKRIRQPKLGGLPEETFLFVFVLLPFSSRFLERFDINAEKKYKSGKMRHHPFGQTPFHRLHKTEIERKMVVVFIISKGGRKRM